MTNWVSLWRLFLVFVGGETVNCIALRYFGNVPYKSAVHENDDINLAGVPTASAKEQAGKQIV